MQEVEVYERWRDGMSMASSRCRELGKLQKDNSWFHVAHHLDEMRDIGSKLIDAHAMSRKEVLGMLDAMVDKKAVN